MKYFKFIFCIVLICSMLSGCSFRFSSSIDDLISPVSPFGNNADIKNALDAYAQNGYSLKAPNYGEYITSYSFFDIDSDGADEAIAFYEPSDNLGTIDMALIKTVDGDWSVIENIEGIGKDVHSLSFNDIDGDDACELIVCWDAIANSSSHELVVYKCDLTQEEKLVALDESVTVNNFICVDMYGDSVDELLMLEFNSGSNSSAKAELYSYANGNAELLGETKLDSHITAYVSLKSESMDGKYRVYADALGSDGTSMLTELIYWSDAYKTIVSPFYSYSTGTSEDTVRHSVIPSLDINDDGIIEIPLDYETDWNTNEVLAVDWTDYKHSVLIHTAYSLFVSRDNYIVSVPEDLINKITASYDEENREMTVYSLSSKNAVFSVKPVLKATYSQDKYPEYTKLLEASGYCYLIKQGNDSEISLTADELTKALKVIK